MVFPKSTKIWKETMDPYDKVDFKVNLTPVLGTTENVTSFTVVPLPEAELYGLTVGTGSYAPNIIDKFLTIWLFIAPAFQADVAFVKGLTLPIEVSITTDSTPPRKKQRTVAVKVIQR